MLDPGKSVFYQMPISVKPSIQVRIAFSRDHGFVILLFNLFQYGLTVIDLFRNDLLLSGNRCNQDWCLRAVVDRPSRDPGTTVSPLAATAKRILRVLSTRLFPYGLIHTSGSPCTFLVGFGITAIDENPLHICISNKRFKHLEPFA